jgi:DNA primase
VRKLGAMVGVAVPEVRVAQAQQRTGPSKDDLYAVNRFAASCFQRFLALPEAGPARDLIARRAITEVTAREFGLGFAPDRWDGLLNELRRNRMPLDAAEDLGLIVKREGGDGHYDRFRNRVMFPIVWLDDEVIAFSGRTLSADKDSAKYVNSPESDVYRKGDGLFGLRQARKAIREAGFAVLVEGNFDVLSVYQAGWRNVVAPLGTALTPRQVLLLKRFAEEVVLLFDGDEAGKKAAARAVLLLFEGGVRGKVALLPPGEDPDSMARGQGPDALAAVIGSARPIFEHLLADVSDGVTPEDAVGKQRVIEAVKAVFKSVQGEVERDEYVRAVARRLALAEDDVRRYVGLRTAPSRRRFAPPLPDAASRPGVDPVEKSVLVLLMERPERIGEFIEAGGVERLRGPGLADLVRSLDGEYASQGLLDPSRVLAATPVGPLRAIVAGVLARSEREKEYPVEDAQMALLALLGKLEEPSARARMAEIDRLQEEADRKGDLDGAARLLEEKRRLAGRLVARREPVN